MNLTMKYPYSSPSRLSSPCTLPCPSCVDDHTAPQTPPVSSTLPASWAAFSLTAVLLPLLFIGETPVYPSRQLHCLLFCEVFPCPFTCISGPGHCSPHHIILHVNLVADPMVKNLSSNAGDVGLIPGSRRSSEERNDNPLQYSFFFFQIYFYSLTPKTFCIGV